MARVKNCLNRRTMSQCNKQVTVEIASTKAGRSLLLHIRTRGDLVVNRVPFESAPGII